MNLDDPKEVAEQFGVSRETMGRLVILEKLTRKWTRKINLIGKSTIPHIWSRHIADSLQLLSLSPPDVPNWTDLGSGAGFPGLVIAICFKEKNPSCKLTLVDSDLRKCLFLKTVKRELDSPLVPLHHSALCWISPNLSATLRAFASFPKVQMSLTN